MNSVPVICIGGMLPFGDNRIILVDINFFSVYCFYLQKMVRKLYNMDIGTGYELIWMNHHMDMVQNTVVCPSEEE